MDEINRLFAELEDAIRRDTDPQSHEQFTVLRQLGHARNRLKYLPLARQGANA